MNEDDKLRIDKYLWSIRLFKTRSLATEACKGGKVKLEGTNLKPSYMVKAGDTYTIQKGPERKIIKVTALLANRVDAKTAVNFYEDLSPAIEIDPFAPAKISRDRGAGRPTKKDRRDIDGIKGE